MPKVTSVEPQKKNPGRFNIFLDGAFAFGADEDLVVERRLVAGKEISPEDLEKILFESEVGKLMERMYGWFGVRMRSEKEVRQKFKIQNSKFKILGKERISDLVVESLIEKLKQKGMVNDEVFARAWVEARGKKMGRIAVKSELMQKGIDREVIEQVLSSMYQVLREDETASRVLEKKVRSWKNLEKREFKQKALQFLMRKGFDYSLAKETVDNYLKKEV